MPKAPTVSSDSARPTTSSRTVSAGRRPTTLPAEAWRYSTRFAARATRGRPDRRPQPARCGTVAPGRRGRPPPQARPSRRTRAAAPPRLVPILPRHEERRSRHRLGGAVDQPRVEKRRRQRHSDQQPPHLDDHEHVGRHLDANHGEEAAAAARARPRAGGLPSAASTRLVRPPAHQPQPGQPRDDRPDAGRRDARSHGRRRKKQNADDEHDPRADEQRLRQHDDGPTGSRAQPPSSRPTRTCRQGTSASVAARPAGPDSPRSTSNHALERVSADRCTVGGQSIAAFLTDSRTRRLEVRGLRRITMQACSGGNERAHNKHCALETYGVPRTIALPPDGQCPAYSARRQRRISRALAIFFLLVRCGQ